VVDQVFKGWFRGQCFDLQSLTMTTAKVVERSSGQRLEGFETAASNGAVY